MITISKDTQFLTLINVFTVDPSNQQALVDLLTRATKEGVQDINGFISASLHRSLDGTKVTMYAQWESIDTYNTMRATPAASPYLEQALGMAKFDPGMYQVVQTFTPGN